MRIKHFTDSDLDGISCGFLSELVMEEVDITYAGPDSINDKVSRLLDWEAKAGRQFDRIIITDLSVSEEVAERIEKSDKVRFKLYDHHKSAEALNRYDWAMVQVEDELGRQMSGTEIYWREYASKLSNKGILGRSKNNRKIENVQELVSLVTRYDTWVWHAEGDLEPKFLNHLLNIYGTQVFKDNLFKSILESPQLLSPEDMTMARSEEARLNKYVRNKLEDVIELEVMGHTFGVVFAEQYKSELGNRMCEEYDIDVAAIVDMGGCSVSYRTSKDDIDLSKIAGVYGGGGHAKAAGSPFGGERVFEFLEHLFEQKQQG